jgi:hypothetical protein
MHPIQAVVITGVAGAAALVAAICNFFARIFKARAILTARASKDLTAARIEK